MTLARDQAWVPSARAAIKGPTHSTGTPSPRAKMLSGGGRRMMFDSSGSAVSAKPGKPSVTRLIHWNRRAGEGGFIHPQVWGVEESEIGRDNVPRLEPNDIARD
jgi:hypothetical protein